MKANLSNLGDETAESLSEAFLQEVLPVLLGLVTTRAPVVQGNIVGVAGQARGAHGQKRTSLQHAQVQSSTLVPYS